MDSLGDVYDLTDNKNKAGIGTYTIPQIAKPWFAKLQQTLDMMIGITNLEVWNETGTHNDNHRKAPQCAHHGYVTNSNLAPALTHSSYYRWIQFPHAKLYVMRYGQRAVLPN